ncbi:MAG: type ISP restriction/modification enzyme, partial [Candidatus Paceibacterota bacterium]
NGFEILMASYAMAHLKLDLLLKETGYNRESDQRFRVYLTNSLEEYHPDTGTLFAGWLSNEANEANHIKRDTPVMVVLGNPPYSVSSSNKSEWIENLLIDYKKDLNERNIQPLSDDYIKFIRYGQYFIEKNKEGILAYISNNSFLDGLIHRQMRKSIINNFNKVFIIDLHGSTKKNEVAKDGSKDQNVFDIQQGVSINIFVKTNTDESDCVVFHKDILGLRSDKYEYLSNNSIYNIEPTKLTPKEPNYFLVEKDFQGEKTYFKGLKIEDLFIERNSGLATEFDNFAIKDDLNQAKNLLHKLKNCSAKEIIEDYNLKKNKIKKVKRAIEDVNNNEPKIVEIDYRPFDKKFTIYTGVSNGFMGRPRDKIMKHMLKDNYSLLTCRQQTSFDFQHVFVSDIISERCSVSLQTGEVNYIFPIYLYDDKVQQQTLDDIPERKPNLNPKIVKKIADGLGLKFTPESSAAEATEDMSTFAPIDLLDYIYAILHSPTYRETYKEFLKIDFPRVPYPDDSETFWKLVELGGELRQLHLMEHLKLNEFITTYPKAGSNEVKNRLTKNDPGFVPNDDNKEYGKVWINEEQYFGNIPLKAWEFYIGGYQPVEKWLKDRRGRTLSMEEIQHYQKIIVALVETDRLMREIDGVLKIDN